MAPRPSKVLMTEFWTENNPKDHVLSPEKNDPDIDHFCEHGFDQKI